MTDDNPILRLDTCYATLSPARDELVLGNTFTERRWRIDGAGRLFPTSLFDKTGNREWLRAIASDEAIPSPSPPGELPMETRRVTLTLSQGRARITEAPSLTALVTAVGEGATLTYRFQIFPASSGITAQLAVSSPEAVPIREMDADAAAMDAPTGIELAANEPRSRPETDMQESLALAPLHLRLIQITLRDRTDHHNELVHEAEWLLLNPEAPLSLRGNLFIAQDVLTGDGLIFLKRAPLPSARPIAQPTDFIAYAAERRVALTGHGFAADDEEGGYPWVVLPYTGGTCGRTEALHIYQRQTRPYEPTRDGLLLSNTWGDRNRDARIRASFLTEEIDAGERLGIDIVQIDDGWQKGKTSNSVDGANGGVWEGFYAAEREFWQAHPDRFPDGLAPLIDRAAKKGLRFGLWFAPDSSDDFAHWRTDAARLLALHRESGVEYFKIDGVKLRTRRGERNLRAFFDRALEASEGRITFDTDVTAETRPGYFGMMDTGPLFLENRYTDFRRYWPHSTLRNLWRLAHYIDPVRLRMEWLNNARCPDRYEGDPLAPAAYRPDYLFATVMFSSPLAWFEVSQLPASYFAEAAPLISVWKRHRQAIFSGSILPIGEMPDGTSWTGFVSVAADRRSAYLLLFREWNTASEYSLTPPLLSPSGEVEYLGGEGSLSLNDGVLTATIPCPQHFLFARLRLPV